VFAQQVLLNRADVVVFGIEHFSRLEQIQSLLGHASVQTIERYIGCRQNFGEAVNDRFRISPSNNAAYEV
jgi:integrase